MKKVLSFLSALFCIFFLAEFSFASIFLDYVKKGDLAGVKEELIKSTDTHALDEKGRTALMIATINGNAQIVEALLADGVVINARDSSGETALFFAVRYSKTNILRLLLNNGADTFARNNSNKTAHMVAEESRKKDIAEIIFLHEIANFDIIPTPEGSAIYRDKYFESAKDGDLHAIRDEMQSNRDLHRRDQNGMNALMYAARSGRAHTTRLLIDYGLDIEARNNGGWTALMLAAVFGKGDVVKVLLDMGANPNAEDDNGETARSLAQENGHIDIVKLFQK